MIPQNEYPLAVGYLVARYRWLALPLVVLSLALTCCAFYVTLAYLSMPPTLMHSVNIGTLSVGAGVRGCTMRWGYFDTATLENNSVEWRVC